MKQTKPKVKGISLQEAVKLGRKRGYFTCEKCGITISLQEPKIWKRHIGSNLGCENSKEVLKEIGINIKLKR